MRRVLLWSFTVASVLFWAFALVMALLEVVHRAHGQSENFAGTFAVQAVIVAAVLIVAARVAAQAGHHVDAPAEVA